MKKLSLSSNGSRNRPRLSPRSISMLALAVVVVIGGLVNYHMFPVMLQTPSPSSQNLVALSPPANNTVVTPVEKKSKFDEAYSITYERATTPKEITNRQPHKLDSSWRRGSGGLDDADRKTLFEIYYNASSVFEWGLGESTLIAAKVGVPRYTGIDSDPVWVGDSRRDAKLKFGVSHFRFLYADIGDIKLFGNPVDNKLQKIQYNYQLAPLVGETKPFDVYMVDGRYRVACACVAFLHALKLGADMEKVRVMVHDNDEQGRDYERVEELGEVVVRNKKLWVYKLRKETTEDMIFNLWKDFEKRQT